MQRIPASGRHLVQFDIESRDGQKFQHGYPVEAWDEDGTPLIAGSSRLVTPDVFASEKYNYSSVLGWRIVQAAPASIEAAISADETVEVTTAERTDTRRLVGYVKRVGIPRWEPIVVGDPNAFVHVAVPPDAGAHEIRPSARQPS